MLSPAVASRLVGRARGPTPTASLSAREIDVLGMVATGAMNKHIAHDLRISEATVKTHLVHVFAKLNVANRSELTALAHSRI